MVLITIVFGFIVCAVAWIRKRNLLSLRNDFSTAYDIYDRGDYVKAIAQLEGFVSGPFDAMAHEVIGHCYYELEQYDKAYIAYQRATQNDEMPYSLAGLGKIALRRFQTDSAIENLERAINLNPQDFMSRMHLAKAYRVKSNQADYALQMDLLLKDFNVRKVLQGDCASNNSQPLKILLEEFVDEITERKHPKVTLIK